MSRYTLVTDWELDAPAERVWNALVCTQEWPSWWHYVERAQELLKPGPDGTGAITRYTWSSRLPYRLTFDMRTTVMERPRRIEGEALGDLKGHGRWDLRDSGARTSVRYTWSVDTGKAWMNALAPLLAPVFEWNHGQVMLEGGRGLARHLGARLLSMNGKPC
ncbi:MAG: SRPBCC family protein [Betaproteobacteria bacterium]|nr:SRPBCC family protein [Betaproteobacteria bacterium]